MAECQALRQSFERAGLPLLFLKGLTSGALAYRNPVTKTAIDIDLLIDPNDLRAAAGLLRECGYRLDVPPEPRQATRCCKNGIGGAEIGLAQRRAGNSTRPHLSRRGNLEADTADLRSLACQVVDIGNGAQLPTLAPDELFAYLAVHGA